MKIEDTSLQWRIDDSLKSWSKLIDKDGGKALPVSIKIFEHLIFLRYGKQYV